MHPICHICFLPKKGNVGLGGPGRLNATHRISFQVTSGVGGRRKVEVGEDTHRRGANCTRAGLVSRVTPHDAVGARVTDARSRPRRDVLQAERRAERPRDSLGTSLVGAAARERQEVRRRGQEQTSRRRRGHRRDRAAQSRTMTTFERNDRVSTVHVEEGRRRVLARNLTRRGQRISSCRSDCNIVSDPTVVRGNPCDRQQLAKMSWRDQHAL